MTGDPEGVQNITTFLSMRATPSPGVVVCILKLMRRGNMKLPVPISSSIQTTIAAVPLVFRGHTTSQLSVMGMS